MIVLQPRPAAEEQRHLAETACAEAARRGERLLLAHSRSGEAPLDALKLYRRAVRAGLDAVYWEQPSRGVVLVAVGAAAQVELRGERRFPDAAAAWRALADGAVANRKDELLALAGFAFGAQSERATHWSAFGDGALVVPELLYRCEGDRASVTHAVIVRPGQLTDDVTFGLASLLDESADDRTRSQETVVAGMRNTVTADAWGGAVAALTSAIAGGGVEKVVLAREVALHAHDAIDETAALARLREGYPDCTVFAVRRGGACFLGATPERLVRVEGRTVRATCLAGSARRGADPQDDDAAGAALLADAKERREHQLVVGMIAEALTPLCREIDIPAEPGLMRMPNVQHLYTPVEGTLSGDVGVLELAERLHPTPAVGGMPRDEALRLIHKHEPFDRGWYAGPIGWLDARGNGEFAVAIRSGLVRGDEARLYAGCGIVRDSVPQREWDESLMKLRPMLCALHLR